MTGRHPPASYSQLLFAACAMLVAVCLLGGCADNEPDDGRIHLDYWEVWSGFERDAMQQLVNDFNASQDRITINFLSVSQMERKLLLATAGGNPPDIAGVRSADIPVFAENGALTPLNRYAKLYGIAQDDYLPAVWNMINLHDRLWGLPTTPGNTALHWNKKLFREAGLDPDTPPKTIAELEAINEQITRFNERGEIEVLGHLPSDPGWWQDAWCYWFGGQYWDGEQITADAPGNIRALTWIGTYPERFGRDKLLAFQDLSGNFASPQNPFFQGRIAMQIQGPWMYNFINNFAPEDFEWGVAPFPTEKPEDYGVNVVETNLLVIPRGAKHPNAAFEFIAWMQQREHIEKLCLLQRKFSPLIQVSDTFYAEHPNPYIKIYRDLAADPRATARPPLTTMHEYQADMNNANNSVSRAVATPAEALGKVQQRQQKQFDRMQRRWNQVKETREAEWDALDQEAAR
ncbi:ABC transporter substrate-binding protein [Cerasicoccus maritimus]|uniref:ABC transporter substrate-binding protein n=1 Tax=Cerasicoccus maritimus TaxID=490089 RepID=UPI0028527C56|nr:ABC transporter substrate-binding protein [Cerasicoccus maritimus]